MSEHILKILLTELATIQICCGNCNTVFETALNGLGNTRLTEQCPVCTRNFATKIGDIVDDPLKQLGEVLTKISGQSKKNFTVQFILPVKVNVGQK